MEYLSKKKFPLNSKDYKLYEEVSEGVSATVYRALCIPFNEIVAVKVLDLERCNNDLMSLAFAKERDLLSQVIQLQQSTGRLIEELQRWRLRNAQLERQLRALLNS